MFDNQRSEPAPCHIIGWIIWDLYAIIHVYYADREIMNKRLEDEFWVSRSPFSIKKVV